MKRLLIVVLSAGLNGLLFAQVPEAPSGALVVKQSNFDKAQWKSWRAVESGWRAKIFAESLKRHGITMSCAGCATVSLVARFGVDASGKLTETSVVKELRCGTSFPSDMKKNWLDYFGGRFLFPPEFRGKSIEVRLGGGLSC